MPPVATRNLVPAMASLFAVLFTISFLAIYAFAGTGTLTASGTQWGVTSQYLGANAGSPQFNINDLVDLAINSYRIYGGMSRWEPTNAESTYGSPNIAHIEANPGVINYLAQCKESFEGNAGAVGRRFAGGPAAPSSAHMGVVKETGR